ncbi:MAG: TrkA family potassium uptake protein [Actinobacteria bacterium]|nr:TrkA family potassium uptake protein [Actinomycetota bacterium]
MNILIIGAGKVGTSLAKDMSSKGHKVSLIEKNETVCEKFGKIKNIEIIYGDGCDPLVLESAGIKVTDVIAAVTGDDEDNLVVAQLAKLQPNRPRVVSIINHPRNEWLFTKSWGIDAAESPTSIITKLIEEDIDKK